MSARKSRVRPVPDFTRAHQLIELQLEARKKEAKCTKVEEFTLGKPSVRNDCSNATPIRSVDFSKPSPRHPNIMQLERNLIPSPISSSDVKVSKPKDRVMNCEQGLQKKACGILKNAGRTDDATTGQQQVRCEGAPFGRRPRVTFDVASPVGRSPISAPRRVPITVSGWSFSPSKMSPKPFAAKTSFPSDRVLVESNRTAMSLRPERQPPQRVPLLGSGQRICTSQSCSKAAFSGGFSRVRADSVAKAIDFNEETEDCGKPVSQDVSKKARQPLEIETTAQAMIKRFGGLKTSPIRRIHVDVRENEDASVCSSLFRTNSNSDAVIRSPLLRKIERIDRKDAKNGSRIPQPRDLKGKVVDKENQPKSAVEKKGKAQAGKESTDENSEVVKRNECKLRLSSDQPSAIEATNPLMEADALEQHESSDTFDANQTISRLEKKAQRLRRRSQLTEEKSEMDSILKKLETLEKKIKSLRMGFRSIRQKNAYDSAGGISSKERSISGSTNSEPDTLMRNELNMCPTVGLGESQLIHDSKPNAPALESTIVLQLREDVVCETPVVASEAESEFKEDTEVSNALVDAALVTAPEPKEDTEMSGALMHVVTVVETESNADVVSDVPHVSSEIDSRSERAFEYDFPNFAPQIESCSEDDVLSDVAGTVPELASMKDTASDIPHVSSETESTLKENFESDGPHFSSAMDSSSSEWKENIDPLSKITVTKDVSLNINIQTATDNPLLSAECSNRAVFQDITEEILSGAAQADEDESVFIVEESSDSELMHSGDYTEWSSSPVALLNQRRTSMQSELSTELSVALSPEDALAERLACLSIFDRLQTSNVEASPNMSSEFMQYKGYEWREGVDGAARLFNPVAAALTDAEIDDVHFLPISPSP